MLNLVSNVLNLFVAINTPSPESGRAETPFKSQVVGEHFQVRRGERIFYKKESWYAQEIKAEGKVGGDEYLLIEEEHGDGCPSMYSLVIVKKDGAFRQYHFGNCMEAVVTKGDSFLEFTFEGMEEEVPFRIASKWRYERDELIGVYGRGLLPKD